MEQNIALTPAVLTLSAVQVTAASEKDTVAEATDQQKTSTSMVSSISAEQISKRPAGNPAQPVHRVSGVTVQDGKSVVVGGTGVPGTVLVPTVNELSSVVTLRCAPGSMPCFPVATGGSGFVAGWLHATSTATSARFTSPSRYRPVPPVPRPA